MEIQFIILILKMQNKKILFAFDMRVQKRILKLQVYQDDSLQDLIVRFSKAAQLNDRFHEKIKEKLENQFEKLILKENCSEKIKSKIKQFLEESKIVIIGISETEVYNTAFTQIPFKILEETFNRNKQSSNKHELRINRVSPIVSKYASKEIYVEQEQQYKPWFEQKKQLSFQRELYSHKSQASIKNLQRNICKLTSQLPAVQEYQTFRHNAYSKSVYNSNQKSRPSTNSNYEAYRLEKSQKGSLERRHESKESIKKPLYYNQQNLIPSKTKPIKNIYDNIRNSKFNFTNNAETKGVSWRFREVKKFNYLEQAKI